MDWERMVTVGRIIRPHGIRGAVVVAPESDFARDRFRPGVELQWQRNGIAAPARITESREFRGRWVVAIDGITTVNEAETLRGQELRIPEQALQPLGAGTFYLHDLEGCAVVTASGQTVGRVSGVQFGSGAPLLAITDEQGSEVLVPMVEGICREIDVANKRIVIDPPDGLIEVNRGKAR
jgi:16S rRNA processing protein RimM